MQFHQEPCALHEQSTDEYNTTLRRLGNFKAEDIPETTMEMKGSKYNPTIQGEPSFMHQMQQLACAADPPVYATQGSDVGKTRGRKPKSKTAKGKNGKSKKGKRGTAGKACKVKNARKARKANKMVPTGKSANSPKKTSPKKTSKKRVGKFHKLDKRPAKGTSVASDVGCEVNSPLGADDQPCHHGPRRIPPLHITANHVYSSAYRHNKALGQEYARAAGKLAAATFRELGYVDDLCGVFRATQRAKAKSPNGDVCTDM